MGIRIPMKRFVYTATRILLVSMGITASKPMVLMVKSCTAIPGVVTIFHLALL
ncbi:hypothetical protein [Arenibacter aquaticus]|uniref:hypothetical protein n=1 Tax=Arenibacter aquaticus TaxID=2489054 RepID=UPI001304FE86|nr:hypothetical protein [Arenibacter aquaticus]